MKLTENGDKVTLEMARGDWDNLLIAVTIAAGVSAHDPDKTVFQGWIDLANRLKEARP
jgi:peroxiredoxin family protein